MDGTHGIVMAAWLESPGVERVLFHPRRAPFEANAIRVPTPDGAFLSLRFHPATLDAPWLLFFHGNGEIASDYDDISPLFAGMGVGFLAMDYRGYGASSGWPSARTLLEDAHTVWEALPGLARQMGFSPGGYLVMGRSLGAAPAIELAARATIPPLALILDSAFASTADLVERLGGFLPPEAGLDAGFDNEGKMARVTCPVLVLHGSEDWIIPPEEGRLLHARAQGEKRLVLIEGAGHNDLLAVDPRLYFQEVGTFLQRLIAPDAP